jgi:nicotinamide riboside kinase
VRVYFTGASGTGKSTLAAHVAEKFGLYRLDSPARWVLKELDLDFERVFREPDVAETFTRAVWERQRDVEQDRKSFVSDRCFDAVAYAAEMTTVCWSLFRDEAFARYVQRLREPDALVFFVRPQESIRLNALDGTRDQFLTPERVHRFDGMILFLLEAHAVPYIPVTTADPRDRMRIVGKPVELLKRGCS